MMGLRNLTQSEISPYNVHLKFTLHGFRHRGKTRPRWRPSHKVIRTFQYVFVTELNILRDNDSAYADLHRRHERRRGDHNLRHVRVTATPAIDSNRCDLTVSYKCRRRRPGTATALNNDQRCIGVSTTHICDYCSDKNAIHQLSRSGSFTGRANAVGHKQVEVIEPCLAVLSHGPQLNSER